jgi:hypothetical protein
VEYVLGSWKQFTVAIADTIRSAPNPGTVYQECFYLSVMAAEVGGQVGLKNRPEVRDILMPKVCTRCWPTQTHMALDLIA